MRKKYARISDGYVVEVGSFEESPGSDWVDASSSHVPALGINKVAYRDGIFVETAESWFAPTVAQVRAHQYPSVGDQLGALWKAIAPLIEHPEAEAILAQIQAVKDANPKT